MSVNQKEISTFSSQIQNVKQKEISTDMFVKEN